MGEMGRGYLSKLVSYTRLVRCGSLKHLLLSDCTGMYTVYIRALNRNRRARHRVSRHLGRLDKLTVNNVDATTSFLDALARYYRLARRKTSTNYFLKI